MIVTCISKDVKNLTEGKKYKVIILAKQSKRIRRKIK